ncbi:lipase secretion chaperone [Thalassolituus sp. LLYu03]|uniref:lipase secretion chaperone n=1 Tax=Thalassolituus sp. LLYu03 TaxID=3421656 RepID=UPI003D28969F
MKPLHGALLLTVLAIAIWVAGWLSEPSVAVMTSDTALPPAGPVPAGSVSEGQAAQTRLDLTELRTFRGATVDGSLRTHVNGELIVDMGLRRWLDFYLSAQGEVPLADLVAAMHQEMERLPQPGQNQAIDLLEDYLGYLTALGQYDEDAQRRLSGADFDAMAARLDWQKRLRREWLQPDVVLAFFNDDEALDDYTLQRIQLTRQGASNAELAALEDTLPPSLRQLREGARTLDTLRNEEQSIRAAGGGDADVQAWRVQKFGAEAAGRLAEADQRQQAWHQRLREYQQYSESLALKGLGETERNQLLEAYRQRHFSEAEIKRLPAALKLLASE